MRTNHTAGWRFSPHYTHILTDVLFHVVSMITDGLAVKDFLPRGISHYEGRREKIA